MIKKRYLLSPGPTPVPEEALASASQPLIHHRTPEFSRVFMEVTNGLKSVFGTNQDVYILASSGTGAMEAAVVNILNPGDKAIALNTGKFGERWAHICRACGVDCREVKIEWGKDFTKEQLASELSALPESRAVFTSLSETSTGAVYDIQGYGEVVAKTGSVLVVDGISGLGAVPCPMDAWKIDVLISGSQKSFMTPPGLSYMAFGPKAWRLVEKATLPRFYFDARKYKESLKKETSPFTPAISLILQQRASLERILLLGLENLHEHHRALGEAVRAGIRALGLELLAERPGNILTAVKVPEGLDGAKLVKTMQAKYGTFIAGGQDPYKGKIFRIAHLGYMGAFEIIAALAALEMTLDDLDFPFEKGSAVKAAEAIIKEKM